MECWASLRVTQRLCRCSRSELLWRWSLRSERAVPPDCEGGVPVPLFRKKESGAFWTRCLRDVALFEWTSLRAVGTRCDLCRVVGGTCLKGPLIRMCDHERTSLSCPAVSASYMPFQQRPQHIIKQCDGADELPCKYMVYACQKSIDPVVVRCSLCAQTEAVVHLSAPIFIVCSTSCSNMHAKNAIAFHVPQCISNVTVI